LFWRAKPVRSGERARRSVCDRISVCGIMKRWVALLPKRVIGFSKYMHAARLVGVRGIYGICGDCRRDENLEGKTRVDSRTGKG
jgi:hypothetical protein